MPEREKGVTFVCQERPWPLLRVTCSTTHSRKVVSFGPHGRVNTIEKARALRIPDSVVERTIRESAEFESGRIVVEPIPQAPAEEPPSQPTAPPPWTHTIDGHKARLIGVEGPDAMIEVLVPDGEPAPGVEPRAMLHSLWEEKAVPIPDPEAPPQEADTAASEGAPAASEPPSGVETPPPAEKPPTEAPQPSAPGV